MKVTDKQSFVNKLDKVISMLHNSDLSRPTIKKAKNSQKPSAHSDITEHTLFTGGPLDSQPSIFKKTKFKPFKGSQTSLHDISHTSKKSNSKLMEQDAAINQLNDACKSFTKQFEVFAKRLEVLELDVSRLKKASKQGPRVERKQVILDLKEVIRRKKVESKQETKSKIEKSLNKSQEIRRQLSQKIFRLSEPPGSITNDREKLGLKFETPISPTRVLNKQTSFLTKLKQASRSEKASPKRRTATNSASQLPTEVTESRLVPRRYQKTITM